MLLVQATGEPTVLARHRRGTMASGVLAHRQSTGLSIAANSAVDGLDVEVAHRSSPSSTAELAWQTGAPNGW